MNKMENIDIIWIILGAIAVILLLIFWRKRNAVWGGLTLGIVIGIIISIFFFFKESVFNCYIIVKGAISGALLGFGAEMLGEVSDFIEKNSK